ncbi:epsin-1 isoform X2 [Lepisosteus oculatus]|uniref:epsin-1 isoform X2 n=1 Tax=Lepisosteus oculatus TaxID=7918 RepID=UPI003720394C
MSTSSLRRQVKNIVHNYSEAEIKVREATSNDPWGPSSSLMSEIADLTYNVVAFSEIMSMVWKRLNDHGKNWRHVYKAMTLMEYLIKTGSERVAQQCRENIYAVQTLKDFQYVDRDGKDQGVNVREKAKQLVALLKDEERLREERVHALKTKEKMAQTSSASSAPSAPGLGGGPSLGPAPPGPGGGADPEQAWPQSSGEEDLQLQLALAMSKEEAEQASLMELAAVDPWGAPSAPTSGPSPPAAAPAATTTASSSAPGPWGPSDPWGGPTAAPPAAADPWGAPAAPLPAPADPWGDSTRASTDPWGSAAVTPPSSDPWAAVAPTTASGSTDPWGGNGVTTSTQPSDITATDPWGAQKLTTNGTAELELSENSEQRGGGAGESGSPVPFDLSSLGSSLPVRKTPESFLGPNAALVDLDSLVSSKPKPAGTHNPFLQTQGPATGGSTSGPGSTIPSRGVSPTPPPTSNPFGSAPLASVSPQPSSLGLSQLRTSPVPPGAVILGTPGHPGLGMVQPPLPAMAVQLPPPQMGLGMVQSSPMGMPYGGVSPMAPPGATILMGAGVAAQPQLILGGGGVGGGGGLGSGVGGGVGGTGGGTTGGSTNPFLL